MQEINSAKQAVEHITRMFAMNGYTTRVFPFTKDTNGWHSTHVVLEVRGKGLLRYFYVVAKSTFFWTYSHSFEGEQGLGESLNKERLKAIENAKNVIIDKILFCYPSDGMILGVNPYDMLDYIEAHHTWRCTLSTGETTGSIPLQMLRRLDREWEAYELEQYIPKTMWRAQANWLKDKANQIRARLYENKIKQMTGGGWQ